MIGCAGRLRRGQRDRRAVRAKKFPETESNMGRQLWDNLGTFVLALFLALLVWIVAINQENPAEERILSEPVSIEFTPSNLLVVGPVITHTAVTVRAPMSVWETLVPNQVHVTAS